jgi:hypothetical protein
MFTPEQIYLVEMVGDYIDANLGSAASRQLQAPSPSPLPRGERNRDCRGEPRLEVRAIQGRQVKAPSVMVMAVIKQSILEGGTKRRYS